jgi:Pyruvate/2-oxoacid:ferredoxin oxidoreductase delta subunit
VRPLDPPPATYSFGYRAPPTSGNEINGHGSPTRSRPKKVFHNPGGESLPWDALDGFFSLTNPRAVVRHIVGNIWQLRRRDGPVAPRRVDVDDPAAMAEQIKTKARELGADLVGMAQLNDDVLYDGAEVPYRFAVSLGLRMDREEMRNVPQPRAAVEVLRVYRAVSRIAIELGEHIRSLGWPARAYGNPNSTDLLHIPLAVQAGLGQLGKHGSLICKEHGSNVRLATVVTDLPLAVDQPVDIGVDDLCLTCRRCVIDCPPDAIYNEKQLVRGEIKWYVDFDKCIPYFTKTHGCAICIQVCPWSEPGRGPKLSDKLLAARDRSRTRSVP